MKTRECMEGAAADDEKYGDLASVRVDDDPMRLTSFGNQEFTELSPASEKGIGDALVNEGAEVPKPYLSPVEVRILTSAAGDSLPAGSALTTLRTIFSPQPLPWSFCENTQKRNNSGMITRRKNSSQLAPFCWRNVIETKLRQNLVFDPS